MTDFLAESLDGNAYLLEEFVDQSFVDDCAKDDLEELTNVQLPLWDDLSPGELYDLLAKENAGKNLPWTKLLNKQWGCIGNALLKVLSLREAKPGIDKSMKVGKNRVERSRQRMLFEKFDEETIQTMRKFMKENVKLKDRSQFVDETGKVQWTDDKVFSANTFCICLWIPKHCKY